MRSMINSSNSSEFLLFLVSFSLMREKKKKKAKNNISFFVNLTDCRNYQSSPSESIP